jgi:putative Mn2+ efflux pump MntP
LKKFIKIFDIQVALAFIPLGFLGIHTIVEKISEDGEDYGSKYYDVNFYVDK